ncbi:hypothetical protein M0Q50_06755 [bacterium]|jgi:hypothetical protein|nr:hypothetical protein [bacterium]
MDQAPFEFNITLIGPDGVEDFVNMLKVNGWFQQAESIEEQFEKQLEDL